MQSSIYDKFVAKAKALAEKRSVGDPWTDVEQGPQVDNKQFDKILELIESGKKEGAKLECGGNRARPKGYFVQVISFPRCQFPRALILDSFSRPCSLGSRTE